MYVLVCLYVYITTMVKEEEVRDWGCGVYMGGYEGKEREELFVHI